MNEDCIILMFLALMCTTSGSGQLLISKRQVTVKSGRSIYLKKDDLVFTRTSKGEECRVEVVQNDPITQRVGYLEPTVSEIFYLRHFLFVSLPIFCVI